MSRPAVTPLRVLHIVHAYDPAVGGSLLLIQKIAEGLVRRGIEVAVFTSTIAQVDELMTARSGILPVGAETRNGVCVRRLRTRRFSRATLAAIGMFSRIWTVRRWRGYGMLKAMRVGPHVPALVRAAIEFDPDVIVAAAAPCLTIFRAAAAARESGKPLAVMPCLHSDHDWFMDNPDLMALLKRADAVMTLTAYESRVLQALGVNSNRLWLIGGAVSPDAIATARPGLRAEFGIADHERVVLFLGRQEESKGVATLLTAMRRLWEQGRSGVVVLAGPPTAFSRAALQPMVDQLPPEWRTRVVLRDTVDEREKWGWYATCDVFAHPARDESFGLVYLEAWLAGKPVIGGRTGPQSCVIDDGRDGLLVQPGDAFELTTALDRLLGNRGLASSLGSAGRAKILEQFTWRGVVDRAEAVYRSLAARHTRAAS